MGRAQKRRNRSQIKYLKKLAQDNSAIFRQELTKRLESWGTAVRKKATRAEAYRYADQLVKEFEKHRNEFGAKTIGEVHGVLIGQANQGVSRQVSAHLNRFGTRFMESRQS